MIIACYNIFNEAEYLEESMKSLKDKVDFIVVVDGAYKNFPHGYPWSTDGSLEIAEKYADRIIKTKKPWESQIEKRNQYFIGSKGDTYLTVDGHEVWKGKILPYFKSNFRVMMQMKDGCHEFFRIFNHQEGIQYRRTHYEVWVGDKLLNDDYKVYRRGFFIHKDISSKEKIKAKTKFYKLPVNLRQ